MESEKTEAVMTSARLEAFSDGVMAIILTIMVLELKVPHGADLAAVRPLLPIFLSYVLSFVFVGVYWNNHHHMMQAVKSVNGAILWANLHLLFWLSLIPFVTGWMGENHFASIPVAFYGGVLLMGSVAYFILGQCLLAVHGPKSPLALALGKDKKGRVSMAVYAAAIPLALVYDWAALILYVGVALFWVIPDRRIEKTLPEAREAESREK